MIHVRLSQSLNLQCGAFTVLVLLALTHSCRGQHHVNGPTIVATVGEDVVLPSLLDPVMDAFGMTVEWTRPDLDPRFVYVWRDGVELESKKHPVYVGRTSVFTDELKLGNISLKLSRVRTSDEGRYRCFIPDLNREYIVQLVVGQYRVVGPTQPIVATVGEDVVLPSHLDPFMDGFGMTVEWTRPDLNPRFVYVWRDGVELESKKHPVYEGRTSVFTDELKLGNISLKLSRVRTSDEGRYRCFIPDLNKDSIVQLVVGAASSPDVQKTKNSSGVVLHCESTGWYPEPEVFWLDGEGNLLSAGPTETVRGPDGLYTVSSRVTVEKRHSNSFTCRVQQNNINQIRETHIHVPDDFFAGPSDSGSSLPVIIGLILGFMFVLVFVAAAVVVWKWRQNKIRNKKPHEDEETRNHPEQELLMGTETDGKQPTEETDRVYNVDEFRAEPGLQTETDEETLQREANNAQCADSEGTETQSAVRGGRTTRETETGLDKSQEETETEAVTETASLNPVSTNLNNTEETQTGTMVEERQKDNNQQTEEEEEQHGDQPTVETVTPDVHKNEEATGPQTDVKPPQTEANNTEGADSEGTEQQSAVRGGRTDQLWAGGTENGSDKCQNETETQDAPLPTDSDQNNKDDETKSVSDNTEKLIGQTENNLQTEKEEDKEKIKCAGDETGAQSLTEEDKHGEQQTAERETLRDREKENLKKKMNTKERELEKFEQKVSRYEKQVKDKEKQINEVKQQLEEVERQTEETERKMRSMKRDEEDDKLLLDLNRKKAELQEQLEKLETLLEGMKKTENNVRQKKLKATNEDKTKERELKKFEDQVSRYEGQMKDKEKKINEVKQQLEEVERQIEETERKMRLVKKAELQEQLEKLETQLEEIKKSENNVRQKKSKATNEKEEIIMKLKELELQRNQRNHSEDGVK